MKISKKKLVALLPMKAHSERIPNKNIKKLGKKELFFHVLDNLKNSGLFQKTIINTDSTKIANLATNKYGSWIQINIRPKYLSGDNVPMNKIIKFDLKNFSNEDHFFQTHSTNPFLTQKTMINSVKDYITHLNNKKHDSLFSVNLIKSRLFDSKLKPLNHNPRILKRTQDLKNIYEENSNFYIFSKKSFILNKNKRIGKKPYFYIMRDRIESLDLDEKRDWDLAEKIVK